MLDGITGETNYYTHPHQGGRPMMANPLPINHPITHKAAREFYESLGQGTWDDLKADDPDVANEYLLAMNRTLNVTLRSLEAHELRDLHPAVLAVMKAWTDEGSHSWFHDRMKSKVRRAMPVLGYALDTITTNPKKFCHAFYYPG